MFAASGGKTTRGAFTCFSKGRRAAHASTQAKAVLGPSSTATDVLNAFGKANGGLKGQNILITGTTPGGIGYETARVLASAGAHIIAACPVQQMCADTEREIKRGQPDALVTQLVTDLGDLQSVHKAAAHVNSLGLPLHVLIHNAGVMMSSRRETKDGLEMDFGVNHVGHWAFMNALLPSLRRGTPSRVVQVASSGQWMFAPETGILWEDLHADPIKGKYVGQVRYGMSKLAQVMATKEFNRRHEGEGIVAVCLHPGMIGATKISTGTSVKDMVTMFSYPRFWTSMLTEAQKNIPQGAATSVYAALAPLAGTPAAAEPGVPGTLTPGGYYAHCALETKRIHHLADDVASQQRLWRMTEEIVAQALAKGQSGSGLK